MEEKQVEALDAMAGNGLTRQGIARALLVAAVEAVQRNGGNITLPPRFVVWSENGSRETGYTTNEPKLSHRK